VNDFLSLDTGGDQVDFTVHLALKHRMRCVRDRALATEVVVEGVRDIVSTQAEQDVNSRRLNVGVHDADSLSLDREERSKVGCHVRFAGPTTE